jgi:hypothetical protein
MERMGKLAPPRQTHFRAGDAGHIGNARLAPVNAPKTAMSRLDARVPNPSNAVVIAVTTPVPHSWCCARADDGSVFP